MDSILGQKKSRFADSSSMNNGFNSENPSSDGSVTITDNVSTKPLSETEVQRMMADVRKQIEERKRKLNVIFN